MKLGYPKPLSKEVSKKDLHFQCTVSKQFCHFLVSMSHLLNLKPSFSRRASGETLASLEHSSGLNYGAKALKSAAMDGQPEAVLPAIIGCIYKNRKLTSAFAMGL